MVLLRLKDKECKNLKDSICYIFAAGDFYGNIKKRECDFFICADAGYRHLSKRNVFPDLLVGDFDSISELPSGCEIKQFPPEKDETDTEIALKEGIFRGFSQFVICGAIGGDRLDHTLANLALGASYASRGFDITLTDGKTIIKPLHNGTLNFSEDESGYVSVFPFFSSARCVTENGLKYPLSNATLDISNPTLCVSNEFCHKKAKISVDDGTILVVWNNEKTYDSED